MKSGYGKAKGSTFERLVATKLSLWVTNDKKKDVFWRSAMSGGRATVALKKGDLIRQSGDICSVAPEGFPLTDKFYIELKFYRNLNIVAFLFGKGVLAKFWDETCKQAKKHKKLPLLIAKENHMPILILSQRIDEQG